MKLLARCLNKKVLIQGCNFTPPLISQRPVFLWRRSGQSKNKAPWGYLELYLVGGKEMPEKRYLQMSKIWRSNHSEQPQEIYCHQRELQVRGPQLFMKEPVKRMAKHLLLEEQPRARWVTSKQVWSCLLLLFPLSTQITWCVGTKWR